MNDWKEAGIVAVGFLTIFFVFTRGIAEAFSLWFAFLAVMFIPGLLIARWLLPDWSAWEQSLFGAFAGFGAGSLVLYYLSFIGIASVQKWVIILVTFAFLAGIFMIEKRRKR